MKGRIIPIKKPYNFTSIGLEKTNTQFSFIYSRADQFFSDLILIYLWPHEMYFFRYLVTYNRYALFSLKMIIKIRIEILEYHRIASLICLF